MHMRYIIHTLETSTDATKKCKCKHHIPGSYACLVQSSQWKTPPNLQQSFPLLFLKNPNLNSNQNFITVQKPVSKYFEIRTKKTREKNKNNRKRIKSFRFVV